MIIKDNLSIQRDLYLRSEGNNQLTFQILFTNQSYKLILNKFPFKHKQDLY
jgi:hypothetical protein